MIFFQTLQESMVFSTGEVSREVREVALEVDHSKIIVDNVLSFVGELLHNFSIILEKLLVSAYYNVFALPQPIFLL